MWRCGHRWAGLGFGAVCCNALCCAVLRCVVLCSVVRPARVMLDRNQRKADGLIRDGNGWVGCAPDAPTPSPAHGLPRVATPRPVASRPAPHPHRCNATRSESSFVAERPLGQFNMLVRRWDLPQHADSCWKPCPEARRAPETQACLGNAERQRGRSHGACLPPRWAAASARACVVMQDSLRLPHNVWFGRVLPLALRGANVDLRF